MVEVNRQADSRLTYYPSKISNPFLNLTKLLASRVSFVIWVDSVIIRINLLITKRSSH